MQETSTGSAGRIEVNDVNAYPETMGQWDLEMRQVSAGEFHGITEYVEVAGMLLYREHFSRQSITTATSPKDSYLFAFNRPSAPDINWCGKDLQQSGLLAYSQPETEIEAITQDNSEHVIVEVPQHLLQQMLPDEDVAALLKLKHHIDADADQSAQFIHSIDQTISTYLAQPEKLNDMQECRAIELQVTDQLSNLILHSSSGTDNTSLYAHKILLNRALDYIHQQNQPITLTELAVAIETTPRSLQRAFNKVLKISPLKYLRLSRMNASHKALIRANKLSSKVTDIALAWGFEHMGRFSCEYRQLFGESPITTLARNCNSPVTDMYSVIRK